MRAWQAFWFRPATSFDLAFGRIVFCAGLVLLYRDLDTSAWSWVSSLFWMPESYFHFLPGIPPPTVLVVLDLLFKLALVFAAIGLWTRFSLPVAFLLALYLLGIPQNFGKIHHSSGLIVVVLGILAFSWAGDSLSIDRWLQRRRGKEPPVDRDGEYRWPLRLIQLIVGLLFFAAGVAKLRVSGWQWVSSGHLGNLLVLHHYTHQPLVDWGLVIARSPLATKTLAFLTIVIELAAPLAAFSERARWILLPLILSMLTGFWLFFGFLFAGFPLVLVAFWVPWERLSVVLRSHLAPGSR